MKEMFKRHLFCFLDIFIIKLKIWKKEINWLKLNYEIQ